MDAEPARPPPGSKVASLLHDYVWPRLRAGVAAVLRNCVKQHHEGGYGESDIHMDDWTLYYYFTVGPTPRRLGPDSGWAMYNVYTPARKIHDRIWPLPRGWQAPGLGDED